MSYKQNIFLFIQILCFIYVNAQEISLLQQFNGRYDFTMIGNTLNSVENESALTCSIYTSSSAVLDISDSYQIEKAFLYWAGSGNGDIEVTLNNQTIIAQRNFSNNFFTIPFFSCFADVTELVQSLGNTTYTLSDLDLNDIILSYCNSGINFGGWAIIIIYKSDDVPVNQLNIYDGMANVYSQNPELVITINNLNVIDNAGAKIGFLAWEGDDALAVNETLQINGNIISNPPLNPMTNVFNGTNSFTGADDMYNMDLDVYDLENYINVGDTQAEIKLTSGQDFVMVNTIVTKLNSQFPDATIEIDELNEEGCFQELLQIQFTIFNHNGTGVLPINTPISVYIDNQLNYVFYTSEVIEVGESLTINETISVPNINGQIFEVKIIIDDDGNGNSTIVELNENNNTDISDFQFDEDCFIEIPDLFLPSSNDNNLFLIEGIQYKYQDFELYMYNRYGNLIFKGNRNNPAWDGKYNGKIMPTGTYFYTLYLNDEDNITYDGWVYLLNY
jgi:gliding motility-associated-like protein